MTEAQDTHQSARTRFTIEAKGVRYVYRRFGKEARANTIAPTRLAYTASALCVVQFWSTLASVIACAFVAEARRHACLRPCLESSCET